ncbi:spidroin-2 [Uranotaenia lowii]|uniref:spidroin-2 n=1 Tax=Uranotaenia lowii TaxID=190385 RepID=UPI002479D562|nr:spidroin-2 [Uranotaenia lowii]
MMSFRVILVFCAINVGIMAQNGYNYDRPELDLGIGSTSRPSFGPNNPPGYPSPSGFGGATRPTASTFQQGSSAGYPSGRPSGSGVFGQPPVATGPSSGSAGYPAPSQTDFSGTGGSYPGSPGATGFGPSASDAGGFGSTAIGARPGTAQRPGANVPITQGPSGVGSPAASNDGQYEGGDYSAIPGEPGIDYPIYSEIPETSFDCKQQQFPGYYADTEAQCQVFHICALNKTFNFLCPNGTIFSQEHFVCVWWNQFDCASAPSLYGKNADLYDNSQTGGSFQGSQGGVTGPALSGVTGPGLSGATGPGTVAAPYPGRPQSGRPGIPSGPTGPSGIGSSGYLSGRPAGAGYPSGSPLSPGLPSGGYPSSGDSSGSTFTSGPSGPGQQIGYPDSQQTGYPGQPSQEGQYSPSPQSPTRDYLPPRQG